MKTLSDKRHIVDGIVSCALYKIRTNKLEETKKFLDEGYYPEKDVKQSIKDLKEFANEIGSKSKLDWIGKINELAGEDLI